MSSNSVVLFPLLSSIFPFLHHQFLCALLSQRKYSLSVLTPGDLASIPTPLLKLFTSLVTKVPEWPFLSDCLISCLTFLNFAVQLNTAAHLLYLEKLPLTFKTQRVSSCSNIAGLSLTSLKILSLPLAPKCGWPLTFIIDPFLFPWMFPPLMSSSPAVASLMIFWVDNFLALDSHFHLATDHFYLPFSK